MTRTSTVLCVLLVVVFLELATVESVERISAHERAKMTMKNRASRFLGRRSTEDFNPSISELLQLNAAEDLIKTAQAQTVQGTEIQRLQETYKGIKVFDAVIAVETDDDGRLTGDATGMFIQGIEQDLPSVVPALFEDEALDIALLAEGNENMRDVIGNVEVTKEIFVDNTDRARLVYVMDYLIENDEGQKRPSFIIDANSGEVLKKWNKLNNFSCGPKLYKSYGGNEKTGRIKYGDVPYCLDLKIEGDQCYLENKYVRVLDMNYTMNENISNLVSFKCKNGYDDEVNGGYSPAVDAFFYGSVVGRMFKEWFSSTALESKITMRVHYGIDYDNAFWNGQTCTFGDGKEMFYPMATALDVVCHEVGHGVTEQGSNLMYFGESGGINEAFSDILGEASESFLLATDMMSGMDMVKEDSLARSFEDPASDNQSIAHVRDMPDDMDPHASSGVYRRVFYVVVEQKGLGIRKATEVFLHANRIYWHHLSDFNDAACGLLKAAYDLGVSTTPFRRGFDDVGIAPCDISKHILGLSNNRTLSNITVGPDKRPVFLYEVLPWAETVSIETQSIPGTKIKITVLNGTWEENADSPGENVVADDYTDLVLTHVAGSRLYVRLSTDELNDVHGVHLTAYYTCMTSYDGRNSLIMERACKNQ